MSPHTGYEQEVGQLHCQPDHSTRVKCPCQPETSGNGVLWQHPPRQLTAEDQPVDTRESILASSEGKVSCLARMT